MDLQARLGVTRIINAAGTYTPVGVSRSSLEVQAACASALGEFLLIDELQEVVGARLAAFAGAEAACFTHCAAAGITLSIAAAMTGDDTAAAAALPQAHGLSTKVVIPATHSVNYGHPILTDIRLAGATPVLVGDAVRCKQEHIDQALSQPGVAALLLVSSRLVTGEPIDLEPAVASAHRHGVAAIIDGAAQDLRVRELLQTGADAVVLSGHKYLASPTAGLVVGSRAFMAAVRLQERGIGRAMKASKEAIVGVDAALRERNQLDMEAWRAEQWAKVEEFVALAAQLPGLDARTVPDPVGMPFPRAHLAVEGGATSAKELSRKLRNGEPPVWVMEHGLTNGELILELVPLTASEVRTIHERLGQLCVSPGEAWMCGAEPHRLPEGVQRVARLLQEQGHPHPPRMLEDAARTAQQAADALGVALGQIAKSVVFRRRSDDAAVLVITSGDRRVDEKKVGALVGDGSRLARADAEFVKARTGFSIGGVAPLAHAHPPVTLIDRELFRFEVIWAAAGHPHGVFQLRPQDLERLTGAPVVDVASGLPS